MNDLLDQVFTVETIMTSPENVSTWPADGDPTVLWNNEALRRFDLVPATREEQIVGLWVRDASQPTILTRDWLISRDTPIPDLLDLFATREHKGLLVIYGQTIRGIVTPADLNKLPMRAYLYNLIGDLEMSLAKWIGSTFQNDVARLLDTLGERRREELKAKLQLLETGNADVDVVELLYLSDLLTIVCKHESLRAPLGFSSRSAANNALGGLNNLRNDIMHPVRPLLEQVPADLKTMHSRVRRARRVLDKLESPLTSDTTSAMVEEFEGDDPGYLRWLKDHPAGYVINTERSRNPAYMVLHRATCWSIGPANTQVRPGGYTERDYIKICAPDIDSLRNWVRRHGRPDGSFSNECGHCRPSN